MFESHYGLCLFSFSLKTVCVCFCEDSMESKSKSDLIAGNKQRKKVGSPDSFLLKERSRTTFLMKTDLSVMLASRMLMKLCTAP